MNNKTHVVLLFAISGCFGSTSPEVSALLNSQWELTTIDLGPVLLDATNLERPPTLVFSSPGGNGAVRIGGFGGCNSFGARAVVKDEAIVVAEMTATEIACTPSIREVEGLYFDVLVSSESFEVSTGELLINTADGRRLVYVPTVEERVL
jgi:heat shock protein HslJ